MRRWAVALFSVLLVGAVCLPVLASSALRLTFEQLVLESDRVVEATLTDEGVSAWGPKNLRIYTTFTFETNQDIAGTGPQRFVIIQPGGRVGRWAQRTQGFPTFRKGDRVVLFLHKLKIGYRVVGLSQGVFGFYRDKQNDVIHQKLEGLDFPGDHGWPILKDRREAFECIRTLWRERRAP